MLSALRNFALTFLISILIFGVMAYFIVEFVMDTLSVAISAESSETKEIELVRPEDTDSPSQPGTPNVTIENLNGDTFNVLLIGTDYQPEIFDDYDYEDTWTGDGFPDKRSRRWGADTLLLLRVDKENRKFVFCSLPRTARVLVDGNNMQLGDVLSEKDIDFLCGKVSGLTGLDIDYHAILHVGALAECVDTLGGLKYYIPEDMSYEDPAQNLKIDLQKGTVDLDGDKAMQLLRYAGYKNGTTGRMNTAISFIQAILAKFTNVTYLAKAPELYGILSEQVQTNFTADDLVNNLDLIFAYSKFEAVTVTYPGSIKSYDGIAYFEPSVQSALDIFDSYQ